MRWRDMTHSWDETSHRIHRRWPETNAHALRRMAGNRDRVARHLAASHDLTLVEAHEALEDWLALIAARTP